jgi:hypothetical protein
MLMEDGDRAIDIILGLVEDVLKVELCHRGIEILKNLCEAEGARVKSDARVGEALKGMARHPVDQVRDIAVEALKMLE